MPVSDPSGGPRGQRPTFQPRSAARVRYYKASMVLAIVFLALVIVLPVWMDLLRRADDREALSQPLDSRAVLAGAAPLPAAAPGATPAPATRRTDVVNTDCRGHVYARCNALRIGPRDCVEIAAEAIAVPIEGGQDACLKVVEPLLAARADTSDAPQRTTAGPASPGTEDTAAGTADSPETNAPEAPADGAAPTSEAPAQAPDPAQAAAGEAQATPEAPAAQPGDAPGLAPRERAQKLGRMQTLVDEFQRGTYNYATPPAVQAARMAELRNLVDEVGTDEAKLLYNRMLEAHRTPPVAVPLEPVVGGYVGDAARVEVGVTDRSPTTTPELETVGAWADAARREAGLPEATAAPAPDEALAPTASVDSQAPAATIGSTAPATAGFVESVKP